MANGKRCLGRAVVVLSILLMQLLVILFIITIHPPKTTCRKESYKVSPERMQFVSDDNESFHQPYKKCSYNCGSPRSCPDVLEMPENRSGQNLVFPCGNNNNNNTSFPGQTEAGTKTLPTFYSIPFKDPCLGSFILQNCYDGYRVPNVVHYVSFSINTIDVYHFLSLLSVRRFLNPCVILLHADVVPNETYWRHVRRLVPNIVHVQHVAPKTIFGKRLSYVQHKSDIARIELLTEYGGIYLDNDQLVLRSLDSFRNYSFVMGHESSNNLGNSLIISEKGAKFLDVWYKSYRSYNPKQWGIHSTFVPFTLAKLYPTLIHIENYSFIKPDIDGILEVYTGHYDWANNYAIHLYTRWIKKSYTIEELKFLNTSLGEIARQIMFGFSNLCIN